ncbi:MAG TPA: MXAN_5187 C-terminal domain-containing protein [Vicinamibacteria bacterium]
MALSEDLDALERSIRQIQIEWDKFFSGIEKKPPNDSKTRLEALIRRHANAEIRNNTERFRYQTLTARYNTLNELWSKKLRLREEGKAFGVHGLKAEALPPPPPPAPAAPKHAGAHGGPAEQFRVQNPERDAQTVRALYESFLQARKGNGETAPVKYESFQKLIGQQASRILSDKGGQAVEFRLEKKEGKVTLKAKVVK